MSRHYTAPMTDEDLIEGIKTYLATHKNVTRGELKRKFNTSLFRLEKLEKAGLVKFPAKLSKSAGATLGRKKSQTLGNWFITRPRAWEKAGKSC